jgi:hypothetical protein
MFSRLNKYVLATSKLYNINNKIVHLPTLYVGNRHLDDYVKDVTSIITKSDKKYIIIHNPHIMRNITVNYTELEMNKSIPSKHLKYIHISYRILRFLWTAK